MITWCMFKSRLCSDVHKDLIVGLELLCVVRVPLRLRFYSILWPIPHPLHHSTVMHVLWMQQKNHHFRWRASYTQNPKTDRGPHMLCWWTTK